LRQEAVAPVIRAFLVGAAISVYFGISFGRWLGLLP